MKEGNNKCSHLIKYINMTREEENKLIRECINGKTIYSDSEIAFGLTIISNKSKP